MAVDNNEQTEEAPEVEAQEAPEQVEQTQEPTSPWANDLQELFTDEGVRGNVDAFLREKVQPYITKIEQDSAADRRAKNLWDQFSEDPYATFEQVAVEIYGEDVADKIKRAMDDEGDPDAQAQAIDEVVAESEDSESLFDLKDLPPEVRRLVEEKQELEAEAAFDDEIKEVKEWMSENNIPFDEEVFYPFVANAEGDIELAVDHYQAWVEKAEGTFGIKLDGADEEISVPPQTISSESRQAAPPPQAPSYESLDEAMDDWLKEENAPPPVVGNS